MGESLALSVVLLRALAESKPVPDQGISASSAVLGHVNKKFMDGCDVASVPHIISLVELTLRNNPQKVNESLYNSLALALSGISYKIEKQALELMRKIVHLPSGRDIVRSLINEIRKIQEKGESMVSHVFIDGQMSFP